MTTRYLQNKLAILTAIGIVFIQVPSLAQGGPNVNADVNANEIYNQIGDTLGSLGVVGSGTVRDTEHAWCVFNDWRARDSMKNTYRGGNINFKTTFGGTWFCVKKS